MLELIVALGILSFLMLSFFTVVTNGLQLSAQNIARNAIREEISLITSQIARDVRASDIINYGSCQNNTCELEIGTEIFLWEQCENSICKYQVINTNKNLIQKSSPNLKIENFFINIISPESSSDSKTLVYISILGSHVNPDRKVTNIFRQVSVATRNYEI